MNVVASIYSRKVRTFIGTNYDTERRAFVDAVKAEYAAGPHIGSIGKDVDGLFYLVTTDGKRFGAGYPIQLRARLAAHRHFGRDVIVS